MIRKRGDKYVVLSEKKDRSGKRNLGSAKTLAGAKKRLAIVEMFKHRKAP